MPRSKFSGSPVEYLVKEKRKELEAIFYLFDEDKDKKFSSKELKNFLHAVGMNLNEKDVRSIMAYHDHDLSGTLSFDEWVTLVTETLAGRVLQDDTLLRAFKLVDTDMDGFILVKDLQEYAKLNAEEARALFAKMDLNKDNRVNYVEFLFHFFYDSDVEIPHAKSK